MASQLYTSSALPPARTITLAGPGGTIELDRKTLAAIGAFCVDALTCGDMDSDFEDEVDEHNGDELGDTSAPEFDTLGRHKARTYSQSLPDEDAEQDDAPEDDDSDCCTAHEDRGSAYSNDDGLPGDVDDAEQEHDAESEQMRNDVPVLPVFALEPNIFTDKRECIGLDNLQPSFVGNGAQVKSAD